MVNRREDTERERSMTTWTRTPPSEPSWLWARIEANGSYEAGVYAVQTSFGPDGQMLAWFPGDERPWLLSETIEWQAIAPPQGQPQERTTCEATQWTDNGDGTFSPKSERRVQGVIFPQTDIEP